MIDHLPHTSSILLDAIRPYPDTLNKPRTVRQGRARVGQTYSWGEGVVVVAPPLHESAAGSRVTEDYVASARHVARLLLLPANWDSYGAEPIDWHRAAAALSLLWIAIVNGAPLPAIVPTSDGSIQLEWHRCGVDLEIRAISGTSFEVFFVDLATGQTSEGEIEVDLAPLRSLLARVTSS